MKHLIRVGLMCSMIAAISCTKEKAEDSAGTEYGGAGGINTGTNVYVDSSTTANTDTDARANTNTNVDAGSNAGTDTGSGTNGQCQYYCQENCRSVGGTVLPGTCGQVGMQCCDTPGGEIPDTGTPNIDSGFGNDGGAGTNSNIGTDSSVDINPDGTFVENSGANCSVSAGELANNPKLPDPFAMNNGDRISTMEEWKCRRAEIKADIEKYEIGMKPERPTVSASYSGGKLEVIVTTNSGSLTLSSNVSGGGGGGASCVVIGMNFNSTLVNGCVQIPFMHNQVVTYSMGGGGSSQNDPFYRLYPELWKVGDYAAWSWGISRLIDGIEQVAGEIGVDTSKIAVHGCSYAGKMALFGGAFDERVALTIAQESGGGGIVSWRLAQDFTNRTNINVEKINNTSSTWFLSSMLRLDPYSLPHDHHELIAMIAPRAVIALGNPQYEWLGDESGYKAMMAAKEVWKAMGIEDRIGMDFTGGHTHCQAAPSQVASVNAFVEKFLKGNNSVDTNIVIEPVQSGFDLNYSAAIDWTTPAIR